ncbi:MAG: hypothetical protein RLZZ221_1417 [Verrucomicrobiota bacterium]
MRSNSSQPVAGSTRPGSVTSATTAPARQARAVKFPSAALANSMLSGRSGRRKRFGCAADQAARGLETPLWWPDGSARDLLLPSGGQFLLIDRADADAARDGRSQNCGAQQKGRNLRIHGDGKNAANRRKQTARETSGKFYRPLMKGHGINPPSSARARNHPRRARPPKPWRRRAVAATPRCSHSCAFVFIRGSPSGERPASEVPVIRFVPPG